MRRAIWSTRCGALWDDTPEHGWFLIALTQTAPAAIRVAQGFTGLTWQSLDDALPAVTAPAPMPVK